MEKKRVLLFFSTLVLIAGPLAWNRQGQSARSPQEQPARENPMREQSPDIPERVA